MMRFLLPHMSKVSAYFLITLLSLSILIIALSNAQPAYATTTWDSFQNLSNNAGGSAHLQIAVSGDNVYIAWKDHTPGNHDIFFRTSSDSGATWSARKNLSNNEGSSRDPQIAVSGDNVYVAWWDSTPGNSEIFTKTSSDSGATWSARKNLSHLAGDSAHLQISVSGDNVYVVWTDHTPGHPDIFFRTSSDSGATWSARKNLSNNAGGSHFSQIAVSGDNVYVAWWDSTPGNSEIFFRAGTTT
jgi:hypothetical protein